MEQAAAPTLSSATPPPGEMAAHGNFPVAAPRRRRLTLPLKTTVILVTLLIAVVALCGGIGIASTRAMLRATNDRGVTELAYGVASVLGGNETQDGARITQRLAGFTQVPSVTFAVLTDTNMHRVAGYSRDESAWNAYQKTLGTSDRPLTSTLGQVEPLTVAGKNLVTVVVPVFAPRQNGDGTEQAGPGRLAGYLHIGSDGDDVGALRYLQGLVLLASIAMVMLALPVASLVARHITVPIQRLAAAADALAQRGEPVRVELARSDELGDLADAFNSMAAALGEREADIRRINAGLEQKVVDRTAELEKVNGKLKGEIAEKEDFLRAVSHDLSAPLRNIAGMAGVLMNKYAAELNGDAVQRLERIQKNVEIETSLINELLELSRIKSRREKIESVDVHELVVAVADGFASDLETRGIDLAIDAHLPAMRCEKARWRQVFQNLIDNAIKYMRPEGRKEIHIGFEWRNDRGDSEGVFRISDSGMGIASEDMPVLFRVFRRAKNPSILKIPGKGVGLAHVKSIIENYGGRLWVESTLGEGTTFFIGIPRNHFERSCEVAA